MNDATPLTLPSAWAELLNVNNIHVHSMIPEDQKNITTQWCSTVNIVLRNRVHIFTHFTKSKKTHFLMCCLMLHYDFYWSIKRHITIFIELSNDTLPLVLSYQTTHYHFYWAIKHYITTFIELSNVTLPLFWAIKHTH